MRYLISVIDNNSGLATEEEDAAIDVFNDRLRAEGHWVMAEGLSSIGDSTTIDNRRGAGLVTAGPFLESKEYVAGFWIIEADDDEKARELAAEGSKSCNRKVELRPFYRG